jgi:hypothetical protein
MLGAADRLVITRSGPGDPEHGTNVAAAISWTHRKLVFERRPLGEVAEEFNRYNRDRIEIESTELQGREVTGVFQSNDAASFVSFLSSIPEVRDDGRGGHIVTIDGKAPADEHPRSGRRSLCILVMSLAWTFVSGEVVRDSEPEPVKYHLVIAGQPLDKALQEFARQSGIQIIFFPNSLRACGRPHSTGNTR